MEISHRKSNKFEFNKAIGWNKVDLCKFAENMDSYSILKEHLVRINHDLGGIIHSCPYRNFVLEKTNFLRFNRGPNAETIFPNGDLKILLRFYNNREKNLVTVQINWKQVNLKRIYH